MSKPAARDSVANRVARTFNDTRVYGFGMPYSAVLRLVRRERRRAIEAERGAAVDRIRAKCPRAHTYASENADVYRAYDQGAADAIEAVRNG